MKDTAVGGGEIMLERVLQTDRQTDTSDDCVNRLSRVNTAMIPWVP